MCALRPAHTGAASPPCHWDPGGGVQCWHGRGECLWGAQDAQFLRLWVCGSVCLAGRRRGGPLEGQGYTPATPPGSRGPGFAAGSSRSKSKTLGSISSPQSLGDTEHRCPRSEPGVSAVWTGRARSSWEQLRGGGCLPPPPRFLMQEQQEVGSLPRPVLLRQSGGKKAVTGDCWKVLSKTCKSSLPPRRRLFISPPGLPLLSLCSSPRYMAHAGVLVAGLLRRQKGHGRRRGCLLPPPAETTPCGGLVSVRRPGERLVGKL